MQITKRDGRIEEFQTAKVIKALSKAFRSCDKNLPEDLEQAVVEHVTKKAQKCERDGKEFRTEDVDNIIEKVLQQGKQHSAFKVYAKKRRDRNRKRTEAARNVFKDIIDIKNTEVTRENANMNADTPAGMMMKFASESTKSFVDEELLDDDVRAFVKDNKLHIHDKDYYPTRSFTCLAKDTKISINDKEGSRYTNMGYFDKYFKDQTITTSPTMGEIKEDVYIVGRDKVTKVLNVSRRYVGDDENLYAISTSKGVVLKATPNHQIPIIDKTTKDEVLKSVEDIQVGDGLLYNGLGEDLPSTKDVEIIIAKDVIDKERVVVYDIETEEHWFTANGYIVHNCVQHPLDHILNEGFQAGHGSSRPAKRIETASVLACISMETAQNEMHGGQAIPAFDFYLAPFVRMSFIEEVKKLEAYDGGNYEHLYNVKISDYIKKDLKGLSGDEKIIQAAINNTVGRVHQAMEAFIHNMNTIHSRGGNQVVFSSINFGTDTSAEGRCVIREILLSTYEGVGDGETAIFPIQIWKSKSGVSYLPGDPNYDLYELACKVTARRFFPNFLNLDATYNQDADWKADDPKRYEHEVATMGCRTRVFENRFGPKTSIGRGNISFSTINIVRLAIECMGIEDENERIKAFFEKLDEALDITAKQLDDRFNFQKQALAKQFPLLMTKLWIGCEDLKATDRVESVINQGTLGIGFIGLAECLVALRGKHHGEDEKSQELGLRIVTHMRDRVNDFCEQYKHNYSVLATPAEGLSGKFTKVDQKEFGKIPGVTDRDYYTNSNHVPVYYKCSAKHKAEVEAPYHELTRGGHIFYVEIDGDATHNPDVVKGVVDMMHAYNMGYGSINHNRNRCMDCGYEDASEGLKVCPKCGSKNLDILQRITGSKNPIE